MIPMRISILTAGCLLALLGVALACRFNVRDVGFVDLGSPPYRFYCLVDQSTPADTATAIKEISAAAFFNTNIEPEVLDAGDAKASRWRSDATLPASVLVAPDGERSLTLPLIHEGELLQDSLWTSMEAVFESPARAEILAKAIDTYGVIVFVEGSDPAENTRIQNVAQLVIARVEDSLGTRPTNRPRTDGLQYR